MTEPLPSPKSRLRAVYQVPGEQRDRGQGVIYQLEDMGDPVLRLRATVRALSEEGGTRYVYRLGAFSRLSGALLGTAELVAPMGSDEEFSAAAREFQTAPFRRVLARLSEELRERYSSAEAGTAKPA
jgi:hypothetical protein